MMLNKSIFAISGSLRAGSSNHKILTYIGGLMPAGISYHIYDELATIPPFDPGLDNDTPPEAIIRLREAIAKADAVIICTPEYAYGIPGQLKNALDWTVSSGSFSGKPTALVTASTGGENAHAALLKVLGAIDCDVIEGGTLLISYIRSKMDSEGNITDLQTATALRSLADKVLKAIAQ
ncbi:NADPH-dependent FMN reductase [Mucilaginibacter sp. 14171R-50]|uniref:NADPH-dependent FMN reductase n=1 Tax=Mucilaginibacter sp. 14171R-50 TaxID=2703789 RepID=UPI001EE46779|nr:NADPH-dependent FMN reductase [Mucilaginibacter sp. 14171R-50]